MKKLFSLMSLMLAIMMIFSACGETQETPTEPSDDPVVEQSTPPTEDELYAISNPLTGELTDTDISNKRPYAFVVNNIRIATPQVGVSKADMIFECPVEGGITRMVAVYQDITDVGVIGSIRSARPYLIDIALSFDPVFVHAGGSDQAYADMNTKGVLHFDGVNGKTGQGIFYRDAERKAKMGYEHSMMTDSSLIEDIIYPMDIRQTHEEGYEYAQSYKLEAQPEGEKAESIVVSLTSSKTTSFSYNAETKKYAISEYNKDYVDGATGEQVETKNVLMLMTDVSLISGDDKGRLNVRTTGEGTGYFACEGKYIPIKWSRENYSSQFVYTLEDGTPLTLGRGNTYVCVMKNGNDITFE